MRNQLPVRLVPEKLKKLDLPGSALLRRFSIRRAVQQLHRRRVPIVLQMSATECGAACLAMILSYYGRQTRLEDCRGAFGTGRDGVSVRTMATEARNAGLRVKAFSIEPAQFEYIQLPAIVHWNFNHFVVVERWSPSQVEIVDPAEGRRQLTTEEFSASFTGVVLVLEPGARFERRSIADQSLWRRYAGQLIRVPGARGMLAQILGASLILQLLGLALPIFTKLLVDQILPLHIISAMTIVGIGMAIVVLSLMVTGYLRATLLMYLQARLDSQMMLDFFEHMLQLPFWFFHTRRVGELTTRLWSNTAIRETLTNQTVSAVLDSGLVLVYLSILLIQSPSFGGLVFVIGLLQVGILLGTARRMQELMQRGLAAQSASHSYLVEALQGIGMLKATGSEHRAVEQWSNLFFQQMNISLRRSHLSAIIDTMLATIRIAAPLILLWVGAARVLDGTMSLGTMLALNALAVAFLVPLTSLVATGQQLQQIGVHMERIADVMGAAPEQHAAAVRSAPQLSGRIEVHNVSFRYSANSPFVLRDISFAIEPGQKVALVGRSGSGKSTLALLLLGLYPPTEGEILYDGISLQELNYHTLRSQFGVVLQESSLFTTSIRQNIAFTNPERSLDEVMAAAQMAAIHDEIMQMPMGYETLLAESGASLSGGQRQRLEIARAILNNPAVLLLDEATSHLDVVTEQQVDKSLNSLSCTRIVIAHRLSTVRNADLILMLRDGTIVERGTHEELLAQRGYYAALIQSQETKYDENTIGI